jgi:hypothetical protein
MTDFAPRLFADSRAIVAIGEGLIAQTLPKADWTHEAHLAATCWIVRDRPDIVPERDMGPLIRAYNASLGGVNDDHQGYHETITRAYIHAIRLHLAAGDAAALPLHECVNALLQSPRGARDWPLGHYSRDLLFSVEARRNFVAPDLAPLDPLPNR